MNEKGDVPRGCDRDVWIGSSNTDRDERGNQRTKQEHEPHQTELGECLQIEAVRVLDTLIDRPVRGPVVIEASGS